MFLALRDITFARGRFSLVAAVVGLITLLVVMLSGLTGGLGKQNTSALEALNPDYFALVNDNGEHSFTSSRVTSEQVDAWAATEGVDSAVPFGSSQTSMTTEDGTSSVAVLSLPAGTTIPGSEEKIPETGVIASESLPVETGTEVSLGGVPLKVSATTSDEYYSHSPVIWTSTDSWTKIAHVEPGMVGTAVMIDGNPATKTVDGTDAMTVKETFNALPAYKSEQGSLSLIQVFLYAISALVTISFLTVWTIQRTRDLAVLRALGASPSYLFKDALGQAAVILAVGAGLGALIGAGLGLLAQKGVPFQLDASTVLLPALGVFVLGILGALISTRRVTKINPLTALNAA
ncbi:ABC transporter permease [Corynebacterium tapiri]|uniref:ABC transporter permease n=1 Tax=Corynebacterium tapiri TaxID=1448266 RepID=A0A5C4U1D8_9CORY|nr:ABC transporter permease [Corynebacterium tapiri]TNL95355.1 ABC transporter permease [Corynebacterium tapiri]